MKDPNVVRAYEKAAPDADAEARVLQGVYTALRKTQGAERRKHPILRRALLAAACVAMLAALLTAGYAAYEKWKLPAPVPYVPDAKNGNVSVHTEQVYQVPLTTERNGPDASDETEPAAPEPLSDEFFLLRAREILNEQGVTGADSATATVRRQKHLYWDREEVEVSWPREGGPISVTFDAETGVFIDMVGIEWVLSDACACETQAEADALAQRYYESLPVEQGYVMTSCEKYDEQFWSYDFCREVEPGLYSSYECVRVAINPVSGSLAFCKVFYVPLLDDHAPDDRPLTREEAEAAARDNGYFILDSCRLVSAEKAVCLPNWSMTDETDIHLKAASVSRLCWELKYEWKGELFDSVTVICVDYYTGELLRGDSTG